jgi:glycosyltransferase involved in cell wall biosynthesis
MRIIHLINSLGVGGAETALLRLCKESREQNIQNTVLYIRGDSSLKEFFQENGVDVFCLTRLREFTEALKKSRNSDILMAWLPMSHLLSIPLKIILNSKNLVWNVRQTLNRFEKLSFFTQKIIILASYFSKYTNAIIYNSNQGKIDHNNMGYLARLEKNIFNGFPIPEDSSIQALRGKARNELQVSDSDFAILFVGRDHPDKGVEYFIQAACQLLKERSNVYYILIGKGLEENTPRKLEISSKFQKNFRFLGAKNEEQLKSLYSAGDIFTSSSISEGFSNVLGEAMSFGLIPVATNVGDSQTIVYDCGIIINSKDPLAIVDAWKKIIASSPTEILNLKNKAKDRIKKNFPLSKTTNEYLKLYSEIESQHD